MSAEVANLYTVLRAETAPFARGLRTAAEEGESFTRRMGGLRQTMVKLGAATTLVGVGFAVYGVKAAGDFQQKMNLLVTACGESSAKLKQVSDGVLSLARQTGTSTNELSDGMYQVEKAGYRAGDGLTVLKAAAQGAREEGASLKDVTNAMTSVMASYHLKASDSVRVMNALKTAAGEGKMTMEEFSRSLSTVIPIASANKISFGEVGGAIATLTQHGTSAQEATQELSNTIRNLAGPSDVAKAEMQKLGLSSIDVSTKLGKRGLTGTLDLLSQTVLSKMGSSGTVLLSTFNKTKQAAADANLMVQSMPPNLQKLALSYSKGSISLGNWRKELKTLPPEQANLLSQYATLQNKTNGFQDALKKGGPAAQTYTDAIRKLTGGATGLNTTLQLTGENMAGFKDRSAKVSASFNHASKDVEGWSVTQKSFNVQMRRLKETVNTAAITIGLKLIPVILRAASYFEKHRTAVIALAAAIGTVLAAALISFATGAIVGAVSGLANIAKGLRVATIAIREFSLAEKLAAVQAKIMAAAQWLLNVAMDANPVMLIVIAIAALVAAIVIIATKTTWFQTIWSVAWSGLQTAASATWKFLKAMFAGFMGAVGAVVSFVRGHWPLLLGILTGPIGIAVLLISHYWSQISGAFKAAYSAVVGTGRSLVSWAAGLPGRILSAIAALGGRLYSWASTAFGKAKSAAVSAAAGLLSWAAGLPGQILSAIGDLNSLLYSAGTDLISGFIGGIESMGGKVKDSLGGLTSKLTSWKGPPEKDRVLLTPAGQMIIEGLIGGMQSRFAHVKSAAEATGQTLVTAFSTELEINSPSRKFRALGAYVIYGLVQGLTGSTASVRAATKRIASDLYSDFGSSHKGLQQTVARENAALLRLAHQRDSVAGRLKAAQKKLSDLGKAWASEKSSVASGIMQNASIITASPDEGRGVNANDVIAQMRTKVQQATQFAAELDQLRKKGLRSDLIQQLATAGVDQAGATALALAGGSSSQIQQMNKLQSGLSSAANATGAAVANSMYGAGIKSAQGLVKGLRSQEKAIEAQMMRIAKSMQAAIKAALGIKSPSRVFAALGEFIPQGLAKGIQTGTKHATSAVGAMASAVVGAHGGAALAGGGGGTTTVIHNHFITNVQGSVVAERQLTEVVRTALLKGGLRNNNIGLTPKR